MQDPVRQRILTRMGIQRWQLRHPALLGASAPAPSSPPPHPATLAASTVPDGLLWLLAPALPAPSLLGDICQLLGMTSDQVALLDEARLLAALPGLGEPPLLWLTEPDPRWPQALICPLAPNGAHKRALWQQLRQRLVITAP